MGDASGDWFPVIALYRIRGGYLGWDGRFGNVYPLMGWKILMEFLSVLPMAGYMAGLGSEIM